MQTKNIITLKNHHYYVNDIPDDLKIGNNIAIDTEAMGLNNNRDRLCLVQFSFEEGEAHLVHFTKPKSEKSTNPNIQSYCEKSDYSMAKNLRKILVDPKILKIFHFARFDVAILQHYLNIKIENIFCTKIASRLVRTYTENHGLKDLCEELLNIKISKQQQSSDWGREILTKEQMEYASKDVIYLHQLMIKLNHMLEREGRSDIAKKCFEFIPTRASLDVGGWSDSILNY